MKLTNRQKYKKRKLTRAQLLSAQVCTTTILETHNRLFFEALYARGGFFHANLA